jgi:hypothetical protein
VEEGLEDVGKKFKRSLSFGKKKSEKDLEALMKASENVSSNRQKLAAQEYEWEPEEDFSNGSSNSRQESKEYDAVGMAYEEDQERAPEDDEGEPETARPPRGNPAITKLVVRPPVRKSMGGSHHGKPIIISEEDCVA